jgi:hypothetical protein
MESARLELHAAGFLERDQQKAVAGFVSDPAQILMLRMILPPNRSHFGARYGRMTNQQGMSSRWL